MALSVARRIELALALAAEHGVPTLDPRLAELTHGAVPAPEPSDAARCAVVPIAALDASGHAPGTRPADRVVGVVVDRLEPGSASVEPRFALDAVVTELGVVRVEAGRLVLTQVIANTSGREVRAALGLPLFADARLSAFEDD